MSVSTPPLRFLHHKQRADSSDSSLHGAISSPTCVSAVRRRAAAFLFILVSVLFLGLFAALPAALAQTPTILKLVSNTENSASDLVGTAHDYAGSFILGPNPDGWKLTRVDVPFSFYTNPPGGDELPSYTMEIWSNNPNNGHPSSLLATLNNPTTITAGINEFTVPGDGIDVESRTRYHVVWNVAAGQEDKRRVAVGFTTQETEEADPDLGGSIGNSAAFREEGTTEWSNWGNPMRFAIYGHAVSSVDSTPPALSAATVNGTALTLTYDEALDANSVPAESAFTVAVGETSVSLAATSPVAVSGSTVVLTLASAVTSTDTVTVSYTVPSSNPIQDTYANPNPAAALTDQSVTNNTPDTTAPSLTTATVNGTTLTLIYDEALDTNSVPAASAFTVTVGATSVSLATSSPVAVSASTVVLTLASAVTPTDTVTVTYVVPGTNPIQDVASNDAAALTNQSATNNTPDTTAPTLSTATVNGATLTLTYNEALDTNSVPTASVFTVIVGGSSDNPSTVEVSGTTVVLTLASAVGPGQTVTVSYVIPSSNPIQDVADNAAAAFTNEPVTNNTADTTAPTLSTATVDGATLTLTYNEALDTNSVPAGSAFTAAVGGTSVNLAATDPVAVSGSTVVLTLASAVTSTDTVTVSYSVPSSNPIQDAAANGATALTNQSVTNNTLAPLPPPMNTDPVLVSNTGQSYANPGQSVLDIAQAFTTGTNSEGYTLTSIDVPFHLVSSTPNYTVEIRSDGASGPGTLVATLSGPDTLSTGINQFNAPTGGVDLDASTRYWFVWDIPAGSPNIILDGTRSDGEDDGKAEGWSIKNESTWREAGSTGSWTEHTNPRQISVHGYTKADTTAPTLTTATVNGATLTLTYDEALDTNSVPAASAFTVKVGATSVSLAATDPVAISGSTVVLTLASAVTPTDTVTVSYMVPTSNPIQDATANGAMTFSNQAVTNNTPDTIAPSLTAATVNGTTLTLTYDEALDTNSVPAGSAFTVKVGATSVSLATSSPVSITGPNLTLTLMSAVTSSDTVTVTYVVPGTNPIQDEAGNDAAALTNNAVNNITATPQIITDPVLISNTGQTNSGSSPITSDYAQAFTTGSSAEGYTLTSVDLSMRLFQAGTGFSPYSVEIWSESSVTSGSPGTREHTLTNPATFLPNGINNFTAPGSGIDLAANTTYFVVLNNAFIDGTNEISVWRSDGGAEDPGGEAGWEIADNLHFRSHDSTGSWTSWDRILKIAVRGNVKTATDITPPTLSSASLAGTALTLTYNEALDTNSVPAESDFTVKVDGTMVALATSNPVAVDGSTVMLTLATAVSDGPTVTVSYAPSTNPIQDANDNAAAALTDQAVTVVDTTPPTLTGASVDGTALTLTYSEALDTNLIPVVTAFSVTVDSGTAANPLLVAVTGMTVTLTLATAVESAGQTVTASYTAPDTNPIQDANGNAAAGFTDQPVTIVETTVPTLSGATVDGTALTLTYSETLDDTSTPSGLAFTVTIDGTAANPSAVSVTGSSVVLTLTTAVDSAGQSVTVSYTPGLTSNPVRDKAENNATGFSNQVVIVVETTAPRLSTAIVEGNMLTLTYDEALDMASMPAASAFSVTVDGTAANPSAVSVVGSTVVLTLASEVSMNSTITVSYTVPASNPIQDRAATANLAAALSNQAVTVVDTTAPSLSTATVAATTLTLTFNEALDTDSMPAASAFSVSVDGTTVSLATTSPVSVTGSTVVLTLASEVGMNSTVTVSYTVPASNPIQDLASNDAVAFTGRAVTVLDTTGPVLSTATVEGTVLLLTYNEALDTGSVPAGSAFTVNVDGTGNDVTGAFVSSSTVVLTLTTAVSSGSNVTVSYAVPSSNPIRDEAGNDATALTDQTVIVGDSVAPMLSTATVEGTTLNLTYNEPLDTNSIPVATAFSVTVDSGTAANPSSVEISGSTVLLTLASAVSPGSTVTVSYTAPSSNPIQDAASNPADNFTDQAVTVVDTTAPVLSTATVEGTALTLTYNEVLDTAPTPASAFTVTVNGTTVGLATTDPVSITGSSVVLTLVTAVSFGSTVTVSYTVPGTNPIRDTALNDAAALTNEPVTILDTMAPVLSTATVEGTTLTLIYNEPLDTASMPAASSFTVTVDGTAVNLSAVSIVGSSVALTLATAVGSGSTVTLNYTIPSSNPIQDLSGNAAAAFSGQIVTVGDTTAPVLSTASVVGTVLTLAYNEPLDTASMPSASAFVVTVGGAPATVSMVAISGSSVVLTLASAVSAGTTVALSYVVPGTNPIQDPSGNAAVAFTDRTVTNETLSSNYATLSALTLADNDDAALTLSPTFSSTVTAYTVTVGNDVTSANVTATASLEAASLSGSLMRSGGTAEAVTMTSGVAVTLSGLAVGNNVLMITVMAAGSTTQTYTVTVKRLSNDASLSELALADADDEILALSPVFSSSVMVYSATMDNDVTSVRVTAMANHAGARLSGSLMKGDGTSEAVTMNSGMAAMLSDLAVGDNVLTITVTAEDGTMRTYTLAVTVPAMAQMGMRRSALKKVLAAMGQQAMMNALDNVGARMDNIAPGPVLTFGGQTLDGQAFGGQVADFLDPPCQAEAFTEGDDCGPEPTSWGVSMAGLFGSSAFSLALGAAEDEHLDVTAPHWSIWGRGDLGSFEGRPGETRYDGDTHTLWLGVDARTGHWVAGLALSRGKSDVDYEFNENGETGSGRLETDLTAVYPYGRYSLSDGTELRGLIGAGTGEARHRSDDAQMTQEKTDLSMWMVSMGVHKALPSVSGVSLAAQGDLSWVRMETDSGPEMIGDLEADGWRVRAGLEASQKMTLADGGLLEPFIEAAGRRDGGDGLTGTGLEVAGGVRYGAERLQVEARGRWLAAHTESGVEEHGLSVTARWSPDTGGRGLSFALTPRWGAATGEADALWGEELPRGGTIRSAPQASMDASFGFGLAAGPNALLTPFVETGISGSQNRVLRLGARYEALRALTLEVSGEHREGTTVEPEQALKLDLEIRF